MIIRRASRLDRLMTDARRLRAQREEDARELEACKAELRELIDDPATIPRLEERLEAADHCRRSADSASAPWRPRPRCSLRRVRSLAGVRAQRHLTRGLNWTGDLTRAGQRLWLFGQLFQWPLRRDTWESLELKMLEEVQRRGGNRAYRPATRSDSHLAGHKRT